MWVSREAMWFIGGLNLEWKKMNETGEILATPLAPCKGLDSQLSPRRAPLRLVQCAPLREFSVLQRLNNMLRDVKKCWGVFEVKVPNFYFFHGIWIGNSMKLTPCLLLNWNKCQAGKDGLCLVCDLHFHAICLVLWIFNNLSTESLDLLNARRRKDRPGDRLFKSKIFVMQPTFPKSHRSITHQRYEVY